MILKLLSLLITATNLANVSPTENKASSLISSRENLKVAISAAKDGDVILVDDIDFTSGVTGLFNVYERIEIKKSITIKGKDSGSTFKRGSFDIFGGKTYADLLNVKFENIIFSLYENNKSLTSEDWKDEAKSQYASFFSGNVNASYKGCSFKGYMNYEGGALYGMYGNYQENPDYLSQYGDQTASKLNINIDKCSFTDNAAYHAGGALFFDGYQDNISININESVFDDNISGTFNKKGWGGGAIYANDITLKAVDSKFTNNLANYVYQGDTSTQDGSQGGAICLINSEFDFDNVLIANNRASYGGGLYFGNTNGRIISSIIENNTAQRSSNEEIFYGKMANSELGGAIYFTGSGHSLKVLNSRIINNLSHNVYSGIAHPMIYGQNDINNIELFYSLYFNKPFLATEFEFDFDKPDDVLAYESFNIKGSVILDEIYKETFTRDEMPSTENGYNRLTSISKALETGLLSLDKDNNYQFNSSSLKDFVVSEQIVNEIFGENAKYMSGLSLGSTRNPSCMLNIYNGKELIGSRIVHFLEEISLRQLESTKLKKFIGYKDKNDKLLDSKFIFDGKENVNSIDIYAKYEYTPLFYFLVIGVPIISVTLIAGVVLTILLIIKKKKIVKQPKPSFSFSDEEINRFLVCYDKVLTNKEKDIAMAILKGKTRDEIASKYFISKSTVKTHINHIYAKLNVSSRNEFIDLVKDKIK